MSGADKPKMSAMLNKEGKSVESSAMRRGRTIRSIHPLGMRVVVKIRKEVNQTETGLYLPEGAKQAKQESILGEVLEVASAIDSDTEEEHNISGIPEGALVLIARDAGTVVPWDEDLRIVETKEVLAIVNEIDVL